MTDTYRYVLQRSWLTGNGRRALWIMLNPSTADDLVDDPTIRKITGFTHRAGYSGLIVANLYGYRATDPKQLQLVKDPVGPDNDSQIRYCLALAGRYNDPVICAWGNNADPTRAQAVLDMINAAGIIPRTLGTTLGGHPRHPLYVPYSTRLRRWPQDQQVRKVTA
jgi:hypothetical protein